MSHEDPARMSSSKYVVDEGEVEAKESPDEARATMSRGPPAKIGGTGSNKSRFAKMEELKKNVGNGVGQLPTTVPKQRNNRIPHSRAEKFRDGRMGGGAALSNMVRATSNSRQQHG